MAEKAAVVREAFRVICEVGRDDLIQPGILSQAWVGLECPRHAAAGGVAAAVLACSPPQQRVSKSIVNACCLGEQKWKIKKETAPTVPGSLGGEALLDVESSQGRTYTSNLSGVKPAQEGRASEEHMAERGGDSQPIVAAPPTEMEWTEVRHGNVPDKEWLLSNTLIHSTNGENTYF
ncbi:hypothetical protein NDU88_002895 [Pleurodeles waltl]|uniref:Uncharacterized protein n=1 Tax=Pleurodeles waltl TaxID=8319 RepID=A0AAV7TMI4_PLEWA|nr:hypothetical protein NDU88_002895 [Pleurodeles waltl]